MDIAHELSKEEREKLINELAKKVVDKGMETAAVLFLEAHKPVTFLAGQAMMVASPFLVPLFGQESVRKYSQLFCDRESVEILIQRIEDIAEEKRKVKVEG